MQDLFVNGTCIASGWGRGAEPIASLNQPSWIHHVANNLNCSNLWNHSLSNKPLQMSIDDTVGFCTQYYSKYKTYSGLFAIIEFSGPQHMQWAPIYKRAHNIVTPTVIHADNAETTASIADKYISAFIEHGITKNYLETKELFHYINPDAIPRHAHLRHKERILEYHSDYGSKVIKQTFIARQQIQWLVDWLNKNNISYLMNWASGTKPAYIKMVDSAFTSLYHTRRFIPMQNYTGTSKGVEWSIEPYKNHPDAIGQARIASFISKWIHEHHLA